MCLLRMYNYEQLVNNKQTRTFSIAHGIYHLYYSTPTHQGCHYTSRWQSAATSSQAYQPGVGRWQSAATSSQAYQPALKGIPPQKWREVYLMSLIRNGYY